jgi:hypothetical protein
MNLTPLLLVLTLHGVVCDERGARVRRIVGGDAAVAPPEDDPVVFTRFAGKTARVLGVRDLPHYVFRGIRYGHAPAGKERFLVRPPSPDKFDLTSLLQRPRQYFLQGFENATRFPPPCVQPVPGQDKVIGDEDCLFLNVFTPTLPTGLEGTLPYTKTIELSVFLQVFLSLCGYTEVATVTALRHNMGFVI